MARKKIEKIDSRVDIRAELDALKVLATASRIIDVIGGEVHETLVDGRVTTALRAWFSESSGGVRFREAKRNKLRL
jgi:hypothetical protein